MRHPQHLTAQGKELATTGGGVRRPDAPAASGESGCAACAATEKGVAPVCPACTGARSGGGSCAGAPRQRLGGLLPMRWPPRVGLRGPAAGAASE